jgi:HEAT repeat protein
MALVKADSQTISPSPQPPIRDLPALLADLAAADPTVRRAAVHDLANYPQAAMDLCDLLEREANSSVRTVLFSTLITLHSPAVAGRLTTHLRSDDVALRNGAIEALQEMPDAVAPHLQQLLSDADSDVRIFAVNILAVLRHLRAPEWLAAVIRSDPHVNVCAAAIDGLAEVGSPEALNDLADLRRRFVGNAFMEFAIDAAMRRIRGE